MRAALNWGLGDLRAAVGEPECPTAGISAIKPDAGGADLGVG